MGGPRHLTSRWCYLGLFALVNPPPLELLETCTLRGPTCKVLKPPFPSLWSLQEKLF